MKVKICGVRSPEAAEAIADAGADFAGLNFVSWSKRKIDTIQAPPIIEALGNRVTPVGVFADHPDVRQTAGWIGLEWVQLHGSESPGVVAELAREFRIIKAFKIDDSFTRDVLDAYVRWVDLFLFDAPRPGGGEPFDWTRIPGSPRPFLLAGGLTPENVESAIQFVHPFGVDAASGVEVDGAQDEDRIAAFVAAARTGEDGGFP